MIRRFLPSIIAAVVMIFIWELAVYGFGIPQYLIPAPKVVLQEILFHLKSFSFHLGLTLLESILGLLVGGAIAFIIAVLFAYSKPTKSALYPYIVAFKSIPLVAIAPLLTIWFGFGIHGKVIMASTICFFPILVTSLQGLTSVHPDFFDLFRTYSSSPLQAFLKLRLPYGLVSLFSGLKVSGPLSVIGAVVAEMTGADQGIGYIILTSSYRNDTPKLFAAVILISAGAIALFKVIEIIEKQLLYWPGALED